MQSSLRMGKIGQVLKCPDFWNSLTLHRNIDTNFSINIRIHKNTPFQRHFPVESGLFKRTFGNNWHHTGSYRGRSTSLNQQRKNCGVHDTVQQCANVFRIRTWLTEILYIHVVSFDAVRTLLSAISISINISHLVPSHLRAHLHFSSKAT